MTERTRAHMRQEFQDGERPSGTDFADVFDSFLSKQDDGISVDIGTGTMQLNQGLRLGNSADGTLGTLRFNGVDLQIHDGVNFVAIGAGGGGGAFETLGSGDVAYTAGNNMGIGTSFSGAAPTFQFEVDLPPNAGPGDQVRFGEAVIYRGAGAQAPAAHFAHRTHATNQNFALRQRPGGEVNINAPLNVPVFFSQGGTPANTRMAVATSGEIVIGATAPLEPSPNTPLHVSGNAMKSAAGGDWLISSDARVKEDVADYTSGLDTVRDIRPVSFAYNGKAGTERGSRGIGVIGQEIETVMPETITRIKLPPSRVDEPDAMEDLRIYDGSPLVYTLVNAVKELADRVEVLEAQLAEKKD